MDFRRFLLILSVCAPSLNGLLITVNPALLEPCTNYELAITSSVVCQNLDAAINFTVSLDQNSTSLDVVQISLEGNHYISSPANFGTRSLSIIGLGGNVTLTCDYYADNETTDSAEIHTWFFNQSRSVELNNLNFVGCGFPFRLLAVRRVHISSCTFR